MKIFQQLQQVFQLIWEGVIRIFSPRDDDYPESGVQPYEGEPYLSSVKLGKTLAISNLYNCLNVSAAVGTRSARPIDYLLTKISKRRKI